MTGAELSLKQAAERVGVSSSTLKRWAESGVIPYLGRSGGWSSAAVAHARTVARLRERGHGLEQIRVAGEEGRLAYGFVEQIFDEEPGTHPFKEVAKELGLEPALIARFWNSLGLPPRELDFVDDDDVEALRHVNTVLEAGFPLVAFLQLCRVYGQALAQIADAEVRLFHIYVHEPLMREGVATR